MDILEYLKSKKTDKSEIESVFGEVSENIKKNMEKLENERSILVLKSKDSGVLSIAYAKRDDSNADLLNIGYLGFGKKDNYKFQEKYSDVLDNNLKNFDVVTAYGENSDLSKEINLSIKRKNVILHINKFMKEKIPEERAKNKQKL